MAGRMAGALRMKREKERIAREKERQAAKEARKVRSAIKLLFVKS